MPPSPLFNPEATLLKQHVIFFYIGLEPQTSLLSYRPQPMYVNFNHSFVISTLGSPEHLVQLALVSPAILAGILAWLGGPLQCCAAEGLQVASSPLTL